MSGKVEKYVLGIDIGANSIGWSVIGAMDENGGLALANILRAGVRLFDQGVEGDIESGKDVSRNQTRRQKRLLRRQFERKAQRIRRIFLLLQHYGLLPPGQALDGSQRNKYFALLDDSLRAAYLQRHPEVPPNNKQFRQTFPYRLRAEALDNKFSPFEIGRALYHLGQRRGFLSNRKAPRKKDEELGKVKAGIAALEHKMSEAKARTLGEYLAGLDPEKEENRIRGRWTARQMYMDEFESIWTKQSCYYPENFSPGFKEKLWRAFFFQRPLKSAKGFVGACSLEPGKRRAPMCSLEAQRFRILQKVNDLNFSNPEGAVVWIKDDPKMREALIQALECNAELGFPQIRKALGLKRTIKFNLEEGGEKKLKGDRVTAAMLQLFGEAWPAFPASKQELILGDLRGIQNDALLRRRAKEVWGVPQDKMVLIDDLAPEEGHSAHSRQALQKLLPLMEQGESYASAKKKLYPYRAGEVALDDLPPLVRSPIRDLRNPVVARCLTELRKVVNALIREHGKPEKIRIEFARDLKRSRRSREETWKRSRENERRRTQAREFLRQEMGIQNPSRADIEKYLLAVECNWECPYTFKKISPNGLFGSAPQFDVEHIVPLSRSLDNSFTNKTLCDVEENRNVKKGRTPFEAYVGTAKWERMLEAVRGFTSEKEVRTAKLRRFQAEGLEEFEEFCARMLTDTSYASKLAKEYLGQLYGQEADSRVEASPGRLTGLLRAAWGLNSILGEGKEKGKGREDHRHHAVDAIVVGLSSRGVVKAFSDSAQRLEKTGIWRMLPEMPLPWEGFRQEVRDTVEGIVAAHRVSKRARGQLHEDTLYGKKTIQGTEMFLVRKRLDELTAKEGPNALSLFAIVDPAVRAAVVAQWERLGKGDPGKVFKDPGNLPRMLGKDGRETVVRSARVRVNAPLVRIGSEHSARYVKLGGNHHVEIVETTEGGRTRWRARMVPLMEAVRRKKEWLPIVDRSCAEGERFVCSIAAGEVLELHLPEGPEMIRVRKMSDKKDGIYVVGLRLNDARMVSRIRETREDGYFSLSVKQLCDCTAKKVTVSPLGRIAAAND